MPHQGEFSSHTPKDRYFKGSRRYHGRIVQVTLMGPSSRSSGLMFLSSQLLFQDDHLSSAIPLPINLLYRGCYGCDEFGYVTKDFPCFIF